MCIIIGYTVAISKDGFTSNYANIAVSQSNSTTSNIVLSPTNSGDENIGTGEVRIVLTWGEYPEDLDSHLFAPTNSYHTFYSNKNAYDENDNILADLDLDDVSSYGPETTTIHSLTDGKYSFYVHDYTNKNSDNSYSLSNSSAKVQVYINNELKDTYNVPIEREGTVWHVFDYDSTTGVITPINEFSYSNDPSTLSIYNVDTNSDDIAALSFDK